MQLLHGVLIAFRDPDYVWWHRILHVRLDKELEIVQSTVQDEWGL